MVTITGFITGTICGRYVRARNAGRSSPVIAMTYKKSMEFVHALFVYGVGVAVGVCVGVRETVGEVPAAGVGVPARGVDVDAPRVGVRVAGTNSLRRASASSRISAVITSSFTRQLTSWSIFRMSTDKPSLIKCDSF